MSAIIYQLPMQVPGMVDVLPNPKFMVVGDNLATLTTAGYLNQVSLESNPVAATDVIQVLYSFNPNTKTGTYGAFSVAISNGVITLALEGAAGQVTLPTIANHIATFTNVAGGISEDPATAISGGNIQAGLSGTAGFLSSFPSAGAKGSLRLTAVANTADTLVTISNALHGQASVYSIPDSGATTANFILSKNATTQHVTVGAIQVDAGAITSGLSTGGFVGLLKAFPTTASEGFIALQAAANASGNFGTTLSNSLAQAQAQVLTIPDVGATTGSILSGGAPFVSGNLIKASGVAGAMVDSGITAASISGAVTQIGNLYQVSVTFNTASMVTAYDTPLTIVANPAASQMILVLQASVYTASTGHTAYATGTAPIIQYSSGGSNGQHGAGTIATAAGLVTGDITAAASQVRNLFGFATGAQTGLSGLGLYFSNATGNYTAGTGTSITITVVYQLLTATV